MCYSPWGFKESDMAEGLNLTELIEDRNLSADTVDMGSIPGLEIFRMPWSISWCITATKPACCDSENTAPIACVPQQEMPP